MTDKTNKDLFLDLEICRKCPECVVDCSYYYHPENNGITARREQGTWYFICRQCEDAPCVEACPQDALEKTEDGRVERGNMLCIRCRTCSIACPFGTVFWDILEFVNSSCDLCEGRVKGDGKPVCIDTCPYDALEYGEFEEDEEEEIFEVEEGFYVHAIQWREEVGAEQKE